MYRELHSLRQALREELKGTLPPLTGVEPDKLLETYLNQLTVYVGMDVADQTVTLLAINANQDELGHLLDVPNAPPGYGRIGDWLESLRVQHCLRIIVVACETTGVFYWGVWDYLAQRPNVARVLYNPRTTEHMSEVLSKRVRDELVDALLLAEQVRLGSTPEVVLTEDADLLSARLCSRAARDEAQSINRKKNQLRSLVRGYNPVISRVFPGAKFHHSAVYALLQQYVFPEECVAAGVEALTTMLTEHSRSAFGADQAHKLVDQCQGLLSHPIRREVVHQRVNDLIAEIGLARQHQKALLKTGYALIQDRTETQLLRASTGAGISNTLALVSEVGDIQRFPNGDHTASFLGLTTSKHVSGTSLYQSKHITKQGSPNGRYAAVNLAFHLSQRVPKYQAMYKNLKTRKPPRKGHRTALVAIARDFVTNILYDMWRYNRPFFVKVEDYRQYRKEHPRPVVTGA
jgi:transposase